jgi:hypothetical protein
MTCSHDRVGAETVKEIEEQVVAAPVAVAVAAAVAVEKNQTVVAMYPFPVAASTHLPLVAFEETVASYVQEKRGY